MTRVALRGALKAALGTADEVADRFLEGKRIPGLVYGVVVDGELVHVRGIGTLRVGEEAVPDADSVFRIASMTKSFTAATILALRDEGRLRLDDPVAAFVPDLATLRGPTLDAPPITIRHLLTMTAGFPTDDPWGDRQQGLDLDEFAALLRAGPSFAWAPGMRFEYSNLGYGILGRVITAAAGREYRDVVRERILEPLEMTATTFDLDDVPDARLAHGYVWRDDRFMEEPIDGYGALAAMGGVFTSIRDLARWVAGFTDAFPPRDDPPGPHPLARATRREMQQVQVSIPPTVAPGPPDAAPNVVASGYGHGLFVADDLRFGRVVSHSGGYPGFGSNMRWQPASGLGVILLANHRYAPMTLLGSELFGALASAGAIPARTLRPSPALVRLRAAIEKLLDAWDDDLAARTFAVNIDLDEPLARRRAELERLKTIHGPLSRDPDEPDELTGPASVAWWLRGRLGGRVRIEISLSPEPEPRIQAVRLTPISDPRETTRRAADGIIAMINAPGLRSVADLPLAESVDRAAVGRAIAAAAARFAPMTTGPVIGSTEATKTEPGSLTLRMSGERGDATLRIAVDASTGTFRVLELRTLEQTPPAHAD